MAGKSLKAKAARGGLWLGAGSGLEQASRLARNMILTRLMAPEAFGLMAIVLAVNTFFESFTEIGIDTAIVQNPRSQQRPYLNGAWWISSGRGLGLYAVLFFGAPWAATFYHQPSMTSLMRVALLGTLLRGAISPMTYVAHKKMDFRRLVMINQGAAMIGVLSTVLLAVLIRDVWALVIGSTVEAGVRCLLSFVLCPFRPGLEFDRECFRALFKFSRGMVGLPLLTFIFTRADIFVIGKLCSATELGIYSMVATLGQIPFSLVGTFMAQIACPAFSEIQDDHARLNSALLKVTAAIALLISPPLLYVALYGEDLLLVAYGRPYVQAAAPFAILFTAAMLRVLSVPATGLYFMIGRPELNRLFTIVRTVLLIALIYPATKWYGLTGAAAAGLVAVVVAYGLQIVRLRTLIGFDLQQHNRIFWKALPISLSVGVVWIASHETLRLGGLTDVMIGALGCILGYAIGFLLRHRLAMSLGF